MSLSELSNVPERPGANPDYTRVPIPLSIPATLGAFDEAGYLDANSDIQRSSLANSHLDGFILKRWANMKDVTSVCPPFR